VFLVVNIYDRYGKNDKIIEVGALDKTKGKSTPSKRKETKSSADMTPDLPKRHCILVGTQVGIQSL
jgi:hypothetical protein